MVSTLRQDWRRGESRCKKNVGKEMEVESEVRGDESLFVQLSQSIVRFAEFLLMKKLFEERLGLGSKILSRLLPFSDL